MTLPVWRLDTINDGSTMVNDGSIMVDDGSIMVKVVIKVERKGALGWDSN